VAVDAAGFQHAIIELCPPQQLVELEVWADSTLTY